MPSLSFADPQADLTAHQHAAALARAHERQDAAKAALLAERQVQAAMALRRLEYQTGYDTEQLATLEAQEAQANTQLLATESSLEKLLPVMQRLSVQPAATLLAAPVSAADAVHGIAILQGISAEIEAQAKAVKSHAAEMAALVARRQAAQARLQAAVAAQQSAEAALTAEIDFARTAEMADADEAARQIEASLAARRKLDSLTDAVNNLVTHSINPQNLPAGSGGAPVAGVLTQGFGAATLAGPAEGVSYRAAPGARVVTPCAGTVMYAGALAGYGLMVIADCGGGSSVILAGMHRLDVETGERLAHGQPVGSMLGYDPGNPTHQPLLYVELRQNGAPVNPAEWLAGGGSG